jgi:hypothetical protein
MANHDITLLQLYGAVPDLFYGIRDLVNDENLGQRLQNDGRYALQQKRLSQKVCSNYWN